MVFNSFSFFGFFLIVYALYLGLNHRGQNRMLLAASYFFYGWWDWRFLSLIFVSTMTDYICGIQIEKSSDTSRRKKVLFISIFVNLGILGFFKYFNFFMDSFVALFSVIGLNLSVSQINIVLPVGISFYTFMTMSYSIDVYRKKIKPLINFFDYALYVCFFPHLVAGPILRATDLLPQIVGERKVSRGQIIEGCWLIYIGLFKKIFVADNLGVIVGSIFDHQANPGGAMVLLGLYAFGFQIYCDFSAYSDIARGLAKLLGIEFMINFNLPYFSKNIQEFWRRWHISLSNWFRDYVYIPLGGSRCSQARLLCNIMIVFLICGLWHGAKWTFVAWGALHGVYLSLTLVFRPLFEKLRLRNIGLWKEFSGLAKIVITFHMATFAWVFFRSQSISQAGEMIHSLIFNFAVSPDLYPVISKVLFYCLPVIVFDAVQYRAKDLIAIFKLPPYVRYAVYSVLFYLMGIYGTSTESFIYFQF